MITKGKFIVIDGTDGSGKATQTKILVDRLKREGKKIAVIDFPRYGKKSASMVEDYLNGKFGDSNSVSAYQASIFYAIDRYAASFKIKKWLSEGKIVISNRYVSANMGHQAAKIENEIERNKFLKWLEELEYGIFQIPRPDKNILLYMPASIGQTLVDKKASRKYIGGKKRDIHEADLNHLQNAAKVYLELAKKNKWIVIDCAPKNKLRTIENIAEELWQKVKRYV